MNFIKTLNNKLDLFVERYYNSKKLNEDSIINYQIFIAVFFLFGLSCFYGGVMAKGRMSCDVFSKCHFVWNSGFGSECHWKIPIELRIWRLIYSPILNFLFFCLL